MNKCISYPHWIPNKLTANSSTLASGPFFLYYVQKTRHKFDALTTHHGTLMATLAYIPDALTMHHGTLMATLVYSVDALTTHHGTLMATLVYFSVHPWCSNHASWHIDGYFSVQCWCSNHASWHINGYFSVQCWCSNHTSWHINCYFSIHPWCSNHASWHFLLKQCLDVLLPCLTTIVNQSLSSASVPVALKQAMVTPPPEKNLQQTQMCSPTTGLCQIFPSYQRYWRKWSLHVYPPTRKRTICMKPFNQHTDLGTPLKQHSLGSKMIFCVQSIPENVCF